MNKDPLALIIRLGALACLSAALGFAGTWSGDLVDSKCYTSEVNNRNPSDTDTFVDTDRGYEIRYCAPNAKTKSFAIVQPDGVSLPLDTAGNTQAAELVQKTGKKSVFPVAVTGKEEKGTIQVDSISLAR